MAKLGPLGLDSELRGLDRRRQLMLAKILRARQPYHDQVVGGVLMPSLFSRLGNIVGAADAERELDTLDERERGVVEGHEGEVAEAMRGLISLSDPFAEDPEEADKLARAHVAGLDTSGAQKARGQAKMMRSLFGFGPPASGGAPPASAPSSSGVPSFGFASPTGRSSPPPAGGNDTPLGHLPDGMLMVMAAIDSPMKALAEKELEARKLDVKQTGEGGFVLLRGGRAIPQSDPLYKELRESTIEYQRQLIKAKEEEQTAQAGPREAAVQAAKAPYADPVRIPNADGTESVVPRDAYAARAQRPQGAPAAAGPAPGTIQIDPSMPDESVLAAVRDARSRAVAGRTQSPGEKVAQEEAARTAALKTRGQTVPEWEPGSRTYRTAPVEQAPGTATRPAGMPPEQLPAGLREKVASNEVTLGKIAQAKAAVKAHPESMGLRNLVPDDVRQRTDPGGVAARALVADIGGQKIYDRSGATVTVGESERLKPYIPKVRDHPDVVLEKLTLLESEYQAMQRELLGGALLQDVNRAKRRPRSVQEIMQEYGGGRR